MAPHGAHVSFASAKIGSFSETTKFLPPFLVYFAVFSSLFIVSSKFCGEIAEKVTPMGFKPMTFRTGIWRSIQLSYGAFMQCKNTLFRWRGQILHSFISVEPVPPTLFSQRTGDIYHSFSPISVQTTRHFRKNNTLFSTKRHDVFDKTTRRFQRNDTLFFYRIQHRSKKILPLVADRILIIFPSLTILLFESANFSKNPSSHARVRARLTGVFTFLLSQVSQTLYKSLYISTLHKTETFFNH